MTDNIGDHIKHLREQRRYSVRQLALRAGVSAAQISRLENGERGRPRPETIKKLAKALNVEYEHLMEKAGYIEVDDAYETSELSDFLKRSNVMFHGQPLTDQDRQRVEDVLTGLFWDAVERKKREGKKNIGSKNGEEDNTDA